MRERVAVLLDGEFMRKVLHERLKQFPTVAHVMSEVERILDTPCVSEYSLYRIFYYTADPLTGTARNPLSGDSIKFANTPTHSNSMKLIDGLENSPDVAVRRGTLLHQGWGLGRASVKAMLDGTKKEVTADDIVPKIKQVGVDMRIGLDIASLALKRLANMVVLVTGDSDFVPAMKFARREGLRVALDPLGRPVRPELKLHADRVIS